MTICTKLKPAFFLFLFCGIIKSFFLYPITVDLKDPQFSEGVLRTQQGGIITAPNLRIQAKNILYNHQGKKEIEAEGELIFELGDYIFTADRLEFDFEANQGVLFNGIIGIEPWFIGGKEIFLQPDGSFFIHKGFATLSEGEESDWRIEAEKARLTKQKNFWAQDVQFRLFDHPILWVPKCKVHLDSIFDSPFRYTVRFGGYEKTRLGISYDAFSWNGFDARLMLDYRFARGLGFGMNLDYKSLTGNGRYHGVNYIARDVTLYNDQKRTRYRYYGDYKNRFDSDRTTILASYDVLSDKEMATDYSDKGLALVSGERTQLEVLREENAWSLHFLTRIRANNFQTVKEELPTVTMTFKPFELASTGIITENKIKLSYLQLEFSEDRRGNHNFTSPRHEIFSQFYRPLKWNGFHLTPQAGLLAIYYGNSPEKFDRWLTMGLFECDLNTHFYKFYSNFKHLITPYLRYQYYTYPETPPKEHFIFDLSDGWYRLDMLRFGIENTIFSKNTQGSVQRKLFSDIYAYSFFDTKTLRYEIPRVYFDMLYYITPYLTKTISTAWDLQHGLLDHWNCRLDWTVSRSFAFRVEYRHRSSFCWRKVDAGNFILDSFRTPEFLRHTEVSDRRDTFLLNLYYRFHQNWAIGIQSRNGWNRHHEPNYNEFQVDLLGTFHSSLHIKISYRHKEEEKDRISFNFSFGLEKE